MRRPSGQVRALEGARIADRYLLPQVAEDLERKMVRGGSAPGGQDHAGAGWAPILAVEAKWSDAEPHQALKYFRAKFPRVEAWQISATGSRDFVTPEGISVAPAVKLLARLG